MTGLPNVIKWESRHSRKLISQRSLHSVAVWLCRKNDSGLSGSLAGRSTSL
jgi:hypothetical protein